jgi:hypothetical protein
MTRLSQAIGTFLFNAGLGLIVCARVDPVRPAVLAGQLGVEAPGQRPVRDPRDAELHALWLYLESVPRKPFGHK